MKAQVSRLALGLLLIAFGVYVYFFPPIRPNPRVPDTKICMDFDTLKPSTLASGLIYNMVQNYRNQQLVSIQTHTSRAVPSDASAIWFELDTIKKFIYHIEKAVKKNGENSSKIGLRFYYAAYPNSSTWTTTFPDLRGFLQDSITQLYGDKHTLVILPTITKDNVVYDFNPNDPLTYSKGLPRYNREKSLVHIPALAPSSRISSSVSSTSATNSTDARNHGVLFPPGNTTGEAFQ